MGGRMPTRSGFHRNRFRWRKRCRASSFRTSLRLESIRFDLQATLANNLLFQETQTRLSGRHTFSYGVEFLVQRATQRPAANFLGQINYTTHSTQYSAFANFLDDFSGPSADCDAEILAPLFSIPINSTRLTFSRTGGCLLLP